MHRRTNREFLKYIKNPGVWLVWIILFTSACTSQKQVLIDLTALTPLPTTDSTQANPIRVAIAAVISPQGTLESYTPLLDYLGKQLDRPVVRVQGSSYAETNEILKAGLVDLAFVCTGAYIHGSDECGMQILAVTEINQDSVYYSWVISPIDNQIEAIEDLRDRTFVFTDPLSLIGWMYPKFMLKEMGENSKASFSQTFFTYSHDLSIQFVADGFADRAAVDSLIFLLDTQITFTNRKNQSYPQIARKIVAELNVQIEVIKVTDIQDIMQYNILRTPGRVVNEEMICSGRIHGPAEVTTWITTAAQKN